MSERGFFRFPFGSGLRFLWPGFIHLPDAHGLTGTSGGKKRGPAYAFFRAGCSPGAPGSRRESQSGFTVRELKQRVCDDLGSELLEPLTQQIYANLH